MGGILPIYRPVLLVVFSEISQIGRTGIDSLPTHIHRVSLRAA